MLHDEHIPYLKNPVYSLCELNQSDWALEKSKKTNGCFVKKLKVDSSNFQLITKNSKYEVEEIHWTVYPTYSEDNIFFTPFHGSVIILREKEKFKLRGYFDLSQRLVNFTVKDYNSNELVTIPSEDRAYFQDFFYNNIKSQADFMQTSLFDMQEKIDLKLQEIFKKYSQNNFNEELNPDEIQEKKDELTKSINYVKEHDQYFYKDHLNYYLLCFKTYLNFLNNISIEGTQSESICETENQLTEKKIENEEQECIKKELINKENTALEQIKQKLKDASKITSSSQKIIAKYALYQQMILILPKSDFKALFTAYEQLHRLEDSIFEQLEKNCKDKNSLEDITILIPELKKLYPSITEKRKKHYYQALNHILTNQSVDILKELAKVSSHFDFHFEDGSTPYTIALKLENLEILKFLVEEMNASVSRTNTLEQSNNELTQKKQITILSKEESLRPYKQYTTEITRLLTKRPLLTDKFLIVLLAKNFLNEYANVKVIHLNETRKKASNFLMEALVEQFPEGRFILLDVCDVTNDILMTSALNYLKKLIASNHGKNFIVFSDFSMNHSSSLVKKFKETLNSLKSMGNSIYLSTAEKKEVNCSDDQVKKNSKLSSPFAHPLKLTIGDANRDGTISNSSNQKIPINYYLVNNLENHNLSDSAYQTLFLILFLWHANSKMKGIELLEHLKNTHSFALSSDEQEKKLFLDLKKSYPKIKEQLKSSLSLKDSVKINKPLSAAPHLNNKSSIFMNHNYNIETIQYISNQNDNFGTSYLINKKEQKTPLCLTISKEVIYDKDKLNQIKNIKHSNVLKIKDHFEIIEWGIPSVCIFSELYHCSLKEFVALHSLDESTLLSFLKDVFKGLEWFRKEHNLVHFNLTSENIVICKENNAYIAKIKDYWVPVLINSDSLVKKIFGTKASKYLPPELWRGFVQNTMSHTVYKELFKIDAYSVVLFFYEMISKKNIDTLNKKSLITKDLNIQELLPKTKYTLFNPLILKVLVPLLYKDRIDSQKILEQLPDKPKPVKIFIDDDKLSVLNKLEPAKNNQQTVFNSRGYDIETLQVILNQNNIFENSYLINTTEEKNLHLKKIKLSSDTPYDQDKLNTIQNIKHPQLLKIKDHFEIVELGENYACVVTEPCYCTLAEFAILHPLNEISLLSLLTDVFKALDYLHSKQGLTHCNLTPENIVICKENGKFKAKLTGYWLSTLIDPVSLVHQRIGGTTSKYLPPELWKGFFYHNMNKTDLKTTFKVDVYSGVLLFHEIIVENAMRDLVGIKMAFEKEPDLNTLLPKSDIKWFDDLCSKTITSFYVKRITSTQALITLKELIKPYTIPLAFNFFSHSLLSSNKKDFAHEDIKLNFL